MKDEKVTANSQHESIKGKAFLTNLIVFYYEITRSIYKERKAALASLT